VVGALLLAGALVAIDGSVSRGASWAREHLGGDIKRELEAIQQFGAVGSMVLVAVVIALLDPLRRRRLWDLVIATATTAAVVQPMKILVGRPRPKFDDPLVVLGPMGRYRVSDEVGARHAWEIGSGISSDLWSMPSSHTAHAVVLGVFLVGLYPRLRPLVVGLVVIVGLSRVLFGAHYPSDVVAGGVVAWVIAQWVMQRRSGDLALRDTPTESAESSS